MFTQTKQCSLPCVLSFMFFMLFGTDGAASQTQDNQPGRSSLGDNQFSSYFFYQQSEYPRDCLEVWGQCSSTNSSGVHLIKPDGYSEAFDVFCDTDGYTVIERRVDGLISFNRSWEDYENGFGFLSQEFWLGNRRLSYLTNQKTYLLRIDVTLLDGSIFYVTYDSFRISDAYGNYRLVSAGTHKETTVKCPSNMVSGNCICQRSCAAPESCTSACHVTGSCVCPDGFLLDDGHCIPRNQCGCFIAEADGGHGIVLQEGGIYMYPNCARKCSCTSGELNCENLQCSTHGSCEQTNNDWNCTCNDGYEGNGIDCTEIVTVLNDCHDVFRSGQESSGVYNVQPAWSQDSFQVYCNMADGGGWTVIQRQDGSGNFYRYWNDYKNGFGSPAGGMWLGNEKLYHMTNHKNYTLRIDLTDRDDGHFYATYSLFRINGESDKYRLSSVGTYGGNTGYDRLSWNVNKQFSTRGQDNDGWTDFDCAEQHQGGWWFGRYAHCDSSLDSCRANCPSTENTCDYFPISGGGCARCSSTNLNGNQQSGTRGRNIYWSGLSGYDCGIQYTEMKIRPVET